eukprot:365004-Chlamydomonas_euryale.AAC.7
MELEHTCTYPCSRMHAIAGYKTEIVVDEQPSYQPKCDTALVSDFVGQHPASAVLILPAAHHRSACHAPLSLLSSFSACSSANPNRQATMPTCSRKFG